MNTLNTMAIGLLKALIRTESFSKQEDKTAGLIAGFLSEQGVDVQRYLNNVWARNHHYDPAKPTVLLNSHHDTVKPNAGYSLPPFEPLERDGKLYGLGSNDAGGPLVALTACFLHFYKRADLPFNLVFAASAEEEISGKNGIEALLPLLGDIHLGLVGEPTGLQLAIAEKGLLVVDCTVTGIAGHAAREEGDNAIYKALKDLEWFRTFRFPKLSETLGPVKMTVSMISAGTQHNVVPDLCRFTVDIRSTDCYSHAEVLAVIREQVDCAVEARSLRLNPSRISKEHPFVKAAIALGRTTYGSPTLSDQALMPFPTLKLGPGESARSHSADEFIYLHEIEEGIALYIDLLNTYVP